MIRVELPIIVLIYFFVLLAALLSLSILYEWRNQKTQKRSLALPGSLHDLCLYFRRQDRGELNPVPALR